jgi:hypothetical protein
LKVKDSGDRKEERQGREGEFVDMKNDGGQNRGKNI